VICVLYGANTPYVFRPVGEHVNMLVGDAYIHGIMYGEALSFPSRQNGGSIKIA
jgi:hypothetical protein